MLVVSMNSKRQRRPNVRLWEIGDLSAAFACSISQRKKEILGQNQWMSDPYFVQEPDYLQSSGQNKSVYCVSDCCLFRKIPDNTVQNRENKDPNWLKSVPKFTNSINRSKLDFGTITRKSRLMRRRRRSPNSNCSLFGGTSMLHSSFDMHHANGIENSSEHETPSMIKEACEIQIDDHDFSLEMPHKSNEFGSEGANYEENTAFTQFTDGFNGMVTHDGNENGVSKWLEEVGFGNYAQMFEMHEVDKDALPLLTFEDLKEMGIVAVGPRRKLYTAIQQLKGGR